MRFALAVFALSIASLSVAFQADDPAKPLNLEKFNTPADETDPTITPDNLALYFATDRNKQFEIFVAKRGGATAAWPAPALYSNHPGANLRTPFLLRGYLYFAADIVPPEFVKLKNYDVFKRVEQARPIPIFPVCEKDDETRPWVTGNGDEFYFSRKTKDGWKIFVAPGPVPGPIGKGKDAGIAPGYSHATLTPNGLTMYMQGPLPGDRLGLFKATRPHIGGAWSQPVELSRINSPDAKRGDQAPCISSDGQRLYFASDRPGTKGGLDLWVISLDKLK